MSASKVKFKESLSICGSCELNNNPEHTKTKLAAIRDDYIAQNPGKRADWDTLNDNFPLGHDPKGHFTDCIVDCIEAKNRGSCAVGSIINLEEI